MSPTLRYSVIAVMLLSTTALGIIAYHAMNPPPPPAPKEEAPPPVVVIPEPPVLEPPKEWVCPYDLAYMEYIENTLGVIPCSLHGATRLVDGVKHLKNDKDADTKDIRQHQTPEEWAVVVAAYERYPYDIAAREAYIRRALKNGPPELDDTPAAPPPTIKSPPQVAANTVKLPAEDNGHYRVKVTINGAASHMLADTGASFVSLTEEDARRFGFNPQALPTPNQKVDMNTANGRYQGTSFMQREITVEGIKLHDVEVLCCTKSDKSLLGMSALKKFNVTITNGWMLLSPKG
jgi:clan AA aspartic protease (TIGR02281 family)